MKPILDASKLTAALVDTGLTVAEFAARAKLDAGTVHKLLGQNCPVQIRTISKIMNGLGFNDVGKILYLDFGKKGCSQ